MPKTKINPDAYRAQIEEKEDQAMRPLCSLLLFWKYCGNKKCVRARACAGDRKDCFNRLWPRVPEQVKIMVRTASKSAKARLSPAETKAEIKREMARWRESIAPRAAPQSLPQSSPIVPAVPNPRLRVL